MKKLFFVSAILVLLISGTPLAKTLILEGKLDSSIAMRQQMEFSVDKGVVQTFTFKFALPADFRGKSVSQNIDAFNARYEPQPSSSNIETDRFGNRFQKVVWSDVSRDIRVNLTYTANVVSILSAMESKTPFPIGRVSGEDAAFLKSSSQVQSTSPEIAELARRLTANARSQYDAVTAITNYVADNIKYTFNPPKYDALYTIETKTGNCQNFAHLCIALLRNVGIPARIVGGITLKDTWKVPIDAKNTIVQGMGQGGHAWMEIFFPDLGWLPYDPQQSRQFTSSRHIKQTHGLDSNDINDTWQGSPYLPRYSELIEGTFKNDDIKLKVKDTGKDPRAYIISNLLSAKAGPAPASQDDETPPPVQKPKPKPKPDSEPVISKPPVKPDSYRPSKPPVKPDSKPVVTPPATQTEPAREPLAAEDDPPAAENYEDGEIRLKRPSVTKPTGKPTTSKPQPKQPVKVDPKKPVKPLEPKIDVAKPHTEPPVKPHKKPVSGSTMVFGNMDFPNLVDAFSVKGDTGTRILDKETSEYVTSQYIFAQAFTLKNSMTVDKVSLAMHKFGGEGNVYIDLVEDDGSNKPNILAGVRSNLVSLDNISRKPGYFWVDFTFAHDAHSRLKPGKYWIVLRYSDAIMNWFYIPGKPFSDSDDTRSTAKGFQWEDILNYDFVFKVSGKSL